jgi:Ion channel.
MVSIPSIFVVVSYTWLILAGMNIAEKRGLKLSLLLIGLITLVCIWVEFAFDWSSLMTCLRILSTLSLLILCCYVLILNIIKTEEICFDMIIAAMSGFLFLGIIGGAILEYLDFMSPGSLLFAAESGTYGYYYFSFIILTSVGFGDVVPQSATAQAVCVFIGLLGQFYLAFGVTVFVGKFLNQQIDQ